MIITLQREPAIDGCVLGVLEVAGRKFPTLERPRSAADKHDSCLPAGMYRLLAMTRAGGERCYGIVNTMLGVWMLPSEVPESKITDARSAVFLASGFTADDLIGSHIAPGKDRIKAAGNWQLSNTRDAMNEIRTLVGHKIDLQLLIEDSP